MEAILFEMYISSNSMSFAKDVPITVAVMIDKGYCDPMYLVKNSFQCQFQKMLK